MSDQIYRIQLHSPMGVKEGRARVLPGDGRIQLDLLGAENTFSGSFAVEYTFEASGTLKTAVSEMSGSLQGSLTASGLRAVFHTDQGDFPLEGVPEEPSAQQ